MSASRSAKLSQIAVEKLRTTARVSNDSKYQKNGYSNDISGTKKKQEERDCGLQRGLKGVREYRPCVRTKRELLVGVCTRSGRSTGERLSWIYVRLDRFTG